MSNDDMLTDDYVAELLAKEAKDCSLKYSSMGLEAFRSNKKPVDKPKPNMRFLRHIIKDTNTHNANLLAKEAAEAQARLQSLESVEEEKKRKRAGPQDIRRRQMGDINAILGARKPKVGAGDATRSKEGEKPAEAARSNKKRHRDGRSASPEERSSRRRHRSRGAESDSDKDCSRRHKKHRRRDNADGDRIDHHRTKTTDKSEHARHRRRSWSPEYQERKRRARSPRENDDLMSRSRWAEKDKSRDRKKDLISGLGRQSVLKEQAASDSDPLDDIIGPAPPPTVRARGRGTVSGSSGIDKRFEEGYDPKSDLQPDEDVNDWDEAVEVFRDRQKWRQNQEQRMRAAGFGDEEIQKWKKGGERNEEDVRWAKVGEKREWDRGKDGELRGLFSEND